MMEKHQRFLSLVPKNFDKDFNSNIRKVMKFYILQGVPKSTLV